MYMRYHWRLAIGHKAIQQRYNARLGAVAEVDERATQHQHFPPLAEVPGDDLDDSDDSGASTFGDNSDDGE